MQNVREEQLLVLLLVMAAQLHQLRDCRGGVLSQQLLDARVDMLTIGQDCPERRSSQQPPARPGMARADRLIIRVEQEIKMIVKDEVRGRSSQRTRSYGPDAISRGWRQASTAPWRRRPTAVRSTPGSSVGQRGRTGSSPRIRGADQSYAQSPSLS